MAVAEAGGYISDSTLAWEPLYAVGAALKSKKKKKKKKKNRRRERRMDLILRYIGRV